MLRRLDNTQVASVQVSIDKARTAAIYRRPSKEFEDQVKSGRVSALALAGGVPLQGGLPIKVDGVVVGAIAASGNTPQEDEDIAAAGLPALEAPQEARYFPAAVVDVAFSKGAPILETSAYKVDASRRDSPGLPELHLYETDVIHVLEGSSTLIVGGSMIDPKGTAFGEIRGKGIVGGTSYALNRLLRLSTRFKWMSGVGSGSERHAFCDNADMNRPLSLQCALPSPKNGVA